MSETIIQLQRFDYYIKIFLNCISRQNSRQQVYRMVAARVGVGEMRSKCITGMEFQFGKMKKFWRWVVVMGCTMKMYLMPLSHTLKNG